MKKILGAITMVVMMTTIAISPIEAKTLKASSYGPTALCKDGTYSYSKNHRGTCSHHKGVRTWYK